MQIDKRTLVISILLGFIVSALLSIVFPIVPIESFQGVGHGFSDVPINSTNAATSPLIWLVGSILFGLVYYYYRRKPKHQELALILGILIVCNFLWIELIGFPFLFNWIWIKLGIQTKIVLS